MKFIAILILLTASGCANIHYSAEKPDGTKVTASAVSFFSGTAVKGFVSDSSTEKTKTGLKFSSSETTPDNEALAAIVAAAIKAAKTP